MRTLFRISFLYAFALTAVGGLDGQWLSRNSGTTENLTDVVMLSRRSAVAVGRGGAILKTSDAGITWHDVTMLLSYRGKWNSISFCDSVSGFIVGDCSAVLSTHDGGSLWMWSQLPSLRTCYSVLCSGPGSCWVGTDSGWVFSTSDKGRTWTSEKISDWPVRSIFRWRGAPLIGVSSHALTAHSICTQYVVPPPSWGEAALSVFAQPGSEAYDAEYGQSGGPLYIVGGEGDYYSKPTVLRKSFADTAFKDVSPATGFSGIFSRVSAPSVNVAYICGSGGIMYKTADAGATWGKQDIPGEAEFSALHFYDENHGLAVGDFGVVVYKQSGGLLGVNDGSGPVPDRFALFQNYPNPINPSTVIAYHLPSASRVILKVYDVLGREVRTLVGGEAENVGRHEAVFDARDLPSGVYLYVLTAGSHVEARKLVVLK